MSSDSSEVDGRIHVRSVSKKKNKSSSLNQNNKSRTPSSTPSVSLPGGAKIASVFDNMMKLFSSKKPSTLHQTTSRHQRAESSKDEDSMHRFHEKVRRRNSGDGGGYPNNRVSSDFAVVVVVASSQEDELDEGSKPIFIHNNRKNSTSPHTNTTGYYSSSNSVASNSMGVNSSLQSSNISFGGGRPSSIGVVSSTSSVHIIDLATAASSLPNSSSSSKFFAGNNNKPFFKNLMRSNSDALVLRRGSQNELKPPMPPNESTTNGRPSKTSTMISNSCSSISDPVKYSSNATIALIPDHNSTMVDDKDTASVTEDCGKRVYDPFLDSASTFLLNPVRTIAGLVPIAVQPDYIVTSANLAMSLGSLPLDDRGHTTRKKKTSLPNNSLNYSSAASGASLSTFSTGGHSKIRTSYSAADISSRSMATKNNAGISGSKKANSNVTTAVNSAANTQHRFSISSLADLSIFKKSNHQHQQQPHQRSKSLSADSIAFMSRSSTNSINKNNSSSSSNYFDAAAAEMYCASPPSNSVHSSLNYLNTTSAPQPSTSSSLSSLSSHLNLNRNRRSSSRSWAVANSSSRPTHSSQQSSRPLGSSRISSASSDEIYNSSRTPSQYTDRLNLIQSVGGVFVSGASLTPKSASPSVHVPLGRANTMHGGYIQKGDRSKSADVKLSRSSSQRHYRHADRDSTTTSAATSTTVSTYPSTCVAATRINLNSQQHHHHHHHHHLHQITQHRVKETFVIYDKQEGPHTLVYPTGAAEHIAGKVNQYFILREIGCGGFGKVLLCQHEENQRFYACKIISKSRIRKKERFAPSARPGQSSNSGNNTMGPIIGSGGGGSASGLDNGLLSIKREIAIFKKISHPNINALVEVLDDVKDDNLYMSKAQQKVCFWV